MSANEPVATTKDLTVKTTKKYEYFDENLTMQSKEVEVTYTEVDSQEAAVAQLNRIGEWIPAANYLIRKEALKNAKASAGVSGGINREVLMNFIKPYRELPQFAGMISATDKRKATAEEWNKQTSAILEQIKNVPFIMDAIKKASEQANASEE